MASKTLSLDAALRHRLRHAEHALRATSVGHAVHDSMRSPSLKRTNLQHLPRLFSPPSIALWQRFRHAEHALRFSRLVFDRPKIQSRLRHALGKTSPMAFVHTQTHIPMKTRMRPLMRTTDVAVLHRVPMDVIEMCLEILFVFQRMLPIPRLPNPATPLTLTARGHNVIAAANLQPSLGKLFLQPTPAFGILAITRRQRPNGV